VRNTKGGSGRPLGRSEPHSTARDGTILARAGARLAHKWNLSGLVPPAHGSATSAAPAGYCAVTVILTPTDPVKR